MLFYRILLFYERVVRRRRAESRDTRCLLCLLRLPSDVRPVYRPTKTLQV